MGGSQPFDWIPSHLLENAAARQEWESLMQVKLEANPNILGRVEIPVNSDWRKIPRVSQDNNYREDAVFSEWSRDQSREGIGTERPVHPVSPKCSGFAKNQPWNAKLMIEGDEQL